MNEVDFHRFMTRVQMTNSCWNWTGGTAWDYGMFWLDGKQRKAHKVMYEHQHGPIPVGVMVCHTCDNHSCVNPAHLFLGNHSKNMQDSLKKGRFSKAKLSPIQVEEVKKLLEQGLSQRKIGAIYGIDHGTVSRIKTGESWKCLQP